MDRLVRASKIGTINSWWPEEMQDHREQKHHNGLTINAHIEAILGQDWVDPHVC
jgi:hypothetical protein